jgi:hypothetical protein
MLIEYLNHSDSQVRFVAAAALVNAALGTNEFRTKG